MKNSNEPSDVTTSLFLWLTECGRTRYDESVTQLEHGLQAAHLASKEGANRYNIVAALLHDVGHLLLGEHEGSVRFLDSDRSHETVGSQWIDDYFGKQVAEPVRLHVLAKRWLYTREPVYRKKLSESSQRSLELQGGNLSDSECHAFEAEQFWQDAVALRLRDDFAKIAGLQVPGLVCYREVVIDCMNYHRNRIQ